MRKPFLFIVEEMWVIYFIYLLIFKKIQIKPEKIMLKSLIAITNLNDSVMCLNKIFIQEGIKL